MSYFSYYLCINWLCSGYTSSWSTDWNPSVDECPKWEKTCKPTIIDSPSFNITTDLDNLYIAQRNGDYELLINIITRWTINQRASNFRDYENRWGSDLIKTLQKKLAKGDFKELVLALTKPLQNFYADELKIYFIKSTNMRLKILDILGTLSTKGIRVVEALYHNETTYFLDRDLHKKAHMSGEILEFFQSLIRGRKTYGITVNTTMVEDDVNALKLAEGLRKTDPLVFKNLVFKRNNAHLRKVYELFFKLSKYTVADSLTRGSSSKDKLLRLFLIGLYKITNCRAIYFAERLHSSLDNGAGVDYNTIRQIVVGRAEIDLGNIKEAYQDIYNRPLSEVIKYRTRKLYQLALLKLLEDPPIVTHVSYSSKSKTGYQDGEPSADDPTEIIHKRESKEKGTLEKCEKSLLENEKSELKSKISRTTTDRKPPPFAGQDLPQVIQLKGGNFESTEFNLKDYTDMKIGCIELSKKLPGENKSTNKNMFENLQKGQVGYDVNIECANRNLHTNMPAPPEDKHLNTFEAAKSPIHHPYNIPNFHQKGHLRPSSETHEKPIRIIKSQGLSPSDFYYSTRQRKPRVRQPVWKEYMSSESSSTEFSSTESSSTESSDIESDETESSEVQ